MVTGADSEPAPFAVARPASEAISASLGGDGRKNMARESSISLSMSVPAAVELLRERHGELAARKMADLEKRKARMARSRKRFEFWAEIAIRMEQGREGYGRRP